jgi:hypothetical protein
MKNKSAISTLGSRGRAQAQDRSVSDIRRKAVDTMSVDHNLWRQLDRWVNEGGTAGDGSAPSQKS